MESRLPKEFRVEYMAQYVRECERKDEGSTLKLVSQVCRKLTKGKSPEEIAEDLDEPLKEIRRITDIATNYAPNYDLEEICDELLYGKSED